MEGSLIIYLILAVVIPLLVVGLIGYNMLKKFFDNKLQLEQLRLVQKQNETTIQNKLVAYERLMLYLERIGFPEIILRVRSNKMTATQLHSALLIAIQKEYEHNLTQQIYISNELWEIIKLARQELSNLVSSTYVDQNGDDSLDTYIDALMRTYNGWPKNPLFTAQRAIKHEASLIV